MYENYLLIIKDYMYVVILIWINYRFYCFLGFLEINLDFREVKFSLLGEVLNISIKILVVKIFWGKK